MEATNETKLSSGGTRTRRTGPQLKQISGKAISKWISPTDNLRELVTILFEDATKRCKSFREDNAKETLRSIQEIFQEVFQALSVPDKSVVTEQEIKQHADWLQAERDKLQEMERSFTEALKLETRKVDKLQAKVDKLRVEADENVEEPTPEIHPTLANFLEEN
ncbi:hypothetical protein ElyMa_001668000 [Elysia marginata]|uniref:Uncharacterized protein n=1 Tax=Elysia marginata TaxID=1093978 RepID=A0AAV4JPE2_9GAST|nr:hypothetical protein ElyMa_001668000 [Elysia marginata]